MAKRDLADDVRESALITGRRRADRTNFAEASDFIGWYMHTNLRRNGVPRSEKATLIEYFIRHGEFDDAVRIVLESKRGSASLLQRRLEVGYARASRLIDLMSERGILGPFKGLVPQDHQSMGLYVGTGDQDNYAKIVVSANGGAGGVEFVKEVNGTASARPPVAVSMPGPDHVDLYLSVDPAAGTIQPRYAVTVGGETGPVLDLGDPYDPCIHADIDDLVSWYAEPAGPFMLVAVEESTGEIVGTGGIRGGALKEGRSPRHLVERYRDGCYVTLRIAASMYHRFHAPYDSRVRRVTYISGDTFNVNPIALKRVERLFCRNERALIRMELTPSQHLITLVPVAAVLVARDEPLEVVSRLMSGNLSQPDSVSSPEAPRRGSSRPEGGRSCECP